MKPKFLIAIILVTLGAFLYLFNIIYNDAKDKAIAELNARQMIIAQQAQKGIENYFINATHFLDNIARSVHVINSDDDLKATLDFALNISPEAITAITRVDASGEIIYTTPYNGAAIGKDISNQKHIQKILETRQPVVSDVFTAVQGYRAIALHTPVFHHKEFRGTIGVLIDFLVLSERYLEGIRLGRTGYAWITSREGVELYCPVPGHIGNSVFENCKDFPSIIDMANKMVQGQKGVTVYTFDRIRDRRVKKVKKHAVYLPIKIVDSFWSIVVASSEEEVLNGLAGFKNKIIVVGCLMLVGVALFSYYGMKAWGMARYVTQLKRTKETLKQSEARFRTIFEQAAVGVALADSHTGHFLRINQRYCEMVGYTMEEILEEKTFQQITHPDDLQTDLDSMARLIAGEIREFSMEKRYVHKNGEIIWVNLTVSPTWRPGEEPRHHIAVVEDITKRKRSEETLRESEERFRVLFENAPLAYQSLDKKGRFIAVNQTWLSTLGYSQADVIGKNFADFLHPDWKDHFKKHFERFQADGEVLGAEFVMLKKDGTEILVSFQGKIGRNAKGEFKQTHCVFQDITQQRKAEEDRKKLEEQLRQSQKMESIGSLAGGVAHEFNNILNIIIGNNELVMEDLPPGSLTLENAKEIHKASFRASDVVKQLLAFSRHDDTQKTALDIGSVVKNAIKLIRSTTPANIEINCSIADNLHDVFGNAAQINQLLMNLCGNAQDAIASQNGLITIELTNTRLDQESARPYPRLGPGQYVRLVVADNGCGMDAATLDRIFDPYFTTKEIGKGTGIGLAVVHGIVERHEGAISVVSQPHEGTAFTLLFPAHEASPKEKSKMDQVAPRGDECILFVDDELSILKLGKKRLEKLGYTVQGAVDPLEALEMFKAAPDQFDMVITDMTMPKMTGEQLAAAILQIRPNMPIMLCTGYGEAFFEEEARKIGVSSFAMKPIDKTDFAIRVRKALDRKKVASREAPTEA